VNCREHVSIERIRQIAGAGPICSECLGRAFGKRGRGLSNAERGEVLRLILAISGGTERPGTCWVCGGLFESVDAWAKRGAEAVRGVEFSTYLFGLRLSPRLREMETHFAERFPTGQEEPLKHAFNREVGKRFERRFEGKTADLQDPDLAFLIDPETDEISVRIASLFVYGRYRKHVRGIPQTRWPCRSCRGRGCAACGETGKQYPESVEEWVAAPFVEAAEAAEERFHGAGREDIDARMLGTGRPFVLELRAPRRRRLDLESLRATVNRLATGKVEVSRLSLTRRKTVEIVKEAKARKQYRAWVVFADAVTPNALTDALASLIGEIEQRTPRRVAHRRADLVRTRRLHHAIGTLSDAKHGEIEFETDGGLYVKELVSGDDGRTRPSLAERLGFGATVTELDVIDVVSEEFPDASVDISDRFS